jgi:hypothetical protein
MRELDELSFSFHAVPTLMNMNISKHHLRSLKRGHHVAVIKAADPAKTAEIESNMRYKMIGAIITSLNTKAPWPLIEKAIDDMLDAPFEDLARKYDHVVSEIKFELPW